MAEQPVARVYGEGITGRVEGNKLMLEVDLSQVRGHSKASNNPVLATTGSYVALGNGAKMQLIVIRPQPK